MASFQSTITEKGIETLTRFLMTGQELLLTRAEIGDGKAEGMQNRVNAPTHPLTADVQIGEKSFIESTPSYLLLPVYVSNKGLGVDIYIREVMLYGLDEGGTEFPFAYAWLEGKDTDNLLPATKAADGALDTVHIHEIALLATDQMQAMVRIEVSGGSWVTAAQMERYALQKPQDTGESGQYLQKTETGTAWADLKVPADFDNLLAYPGCTRTMQKESASEDDTVTRTYTEQVKTAAGILRAQRVTAAVYDVKELDDETYTYLREITETYTFYAEDGESITAKFTVRTTKDEEENWTETVTKEDLA